MGMEYILEFLEDSAKGIKNLIHEGKSCTVFDYSTPRICPFCRFLYHDELKHFLHFVCNWIKYHKSCEGKNVIIF